MAAARFLRFFEKLPIFRRAVFVCYRASKDCFAIESLPGYICGGGVVSVARFLNQVNQSRLFGEARFAFQSID
jgi:hypothetical protein